MEIKLKEKYLKEIEDIQSHFASIELANEGDVFNVKIRSIEAIKRIAGINSEYYQRIGDIELGRIRYTEQHKIKYIMGSLKALYQDLRADYLKSFTEIIHDDIFSDFLEMAEHLLKEGYKDAAAVIAGSTLEEHLRKLCEKNVIEITFTATNGNIKFKKADTLNSELARESVYSKGEQKQNTAWFDIRNNAAHGNYDAYDKDQVKNMISGLRDFFIRNPA